MINYETLLSSYDDKLTLMQWLKKVEEALKDASAVSFKVNKRGDATLTFSVLFEDGSELETGPIILQQGESVQAATIRNGHLILTLTNGGELDAGDLGAVSGFSINASQHLIVAYQNGTTQDLGAIFTGNVNITGALAVTGKITGGEIVENMTGYSAAPMPLNNGTNTALYYGACKNGNKLTLVACGVITKTSEGYWRSIASFDIPAAVNEKLVPFYGARFDIRRVAIFSAYNQDSPQSIETNIMVTKGSGDNPTLYIGLDMGTMAIDTPYFYRIECTYLLNDNLAA